MAPVAFALTACGSSHERLNKAGDAPGVIHGVVKVAGGPAGASPKPPSGTVIVSRSGDDLGQQSVTAAGTYRFSLPPGSYHLVLKDNPVCSADAKVTPESDQEIDILCNYK
jgi:hypothetical protein